MHSMVFASQRLDALKCNESLSNEGAEAVGESKGQATCIMTLSPGCPFSRSAIITVGDVFVLFQFITEAGHALPSNMRTIVQ